MTKSTTHFGIVLMGWVSLLGAGLIACQTLKAWPDQTPQSEPPAAAERPAQEANKAIRTDCFGDPLPPGALARMGTVRLFNESASNLLAFSPDGKILVSHIHGMTVALWDTATGKEIRRLTADAVKGGIGALGFSRDGKTLIAVSHWTDRKVCLWEVATGKLLRTMDDFQGRREVYWSMALTSLPDDRILAAAAFDNVNGKKVLGAYIWDLATGKEVRLMAEPRKKESHLLGALTFSPDGKLLAAAEQKNIYLWDVATGKEIHPLTHNADAPGERGVSGLAFSHDGKMLASIDGHTEGGIACVWDVASGKLLRRLTVPANSAAVALSPDGKTLVGGKESYLWEVSSGKEIRSLGLQDATVALFSPDGKTLAMGDRAGVIRLWNMASGKEIFPHPGHRQRIESVVNSPDGKTSASLGADQTTRLWDVATGKELRQLAKNTAPWNTSIAYSPDGKTLASIEGKVLHLWDTATGKEIRQFEAERWIVSVAFSPDGRLMAWSWNSVILWDVATGKQEVYKPAFKGQVNGVVFSPDGRLLAALGRDNTVSLLEVVTGNLVGQFGEAKPSGPQGGQTSVRFLAFSPNNRVVATSSTGDDKVRLWEVASGKQTGQLDVYKHCIKDKQMLPGQFSDWFGCVLAFSPDGRMLATAMPGVPVSHRDDLAVTLWEVASGQEIARLAGHRKAIWTLAFSPDGKTLTSGSDDLTCLVWDVMAVTGRRKPAATNALSPKSLSQEQLAAAWTDLASKDAAKAYQAISALCAAPEQAVPLLKQRIRPATAADPEQLTRWIADLDSERFAVRDKAQRAIEALDESAIPALRRALANQPSLEVKRRLQNILAVIEPKVVAVDSPEQLRQKRAVQVLESVATPEARQLLQDLAKGVAEVSLTREAQAALQRLARRSASRP